MVKKRVESSVFEIIVILAIVGMVAFTGQMLIYFDKQGVSFAGSSSMTGFAVADGGEEKTFTDVSVKSIEVNPPSPLVGQSFEVRAVVANLGTETISTPFYVQLSILAADDSQAKPTTINTAIPMILKPGQETAAVFNVATVSKEGAWRVTVNADSTDKLADANWANNLRSKTVIITNE
jgi:hypothetical protein